MVPCAADAGHFEITRRFNSVEKMSERRGHFTRTGRFTAVPVTVTELGEHDDGYVHPIAGKPRAGATYSGRFTITGTFRHNERVTVETSSSGQRHEPGGDVMRARAVFHTTTVNGETKSSIERERCLPNSGLDRHGDPRARVSADRLVLGRASIVGPASIPRPSDRDQDRKASGTRVRQQRPRAASAGRGLCFWWAILVSNQ